MPCGPTLRSRWHRAAHNPDTPRRRFAPPCGRREFFEVDGATTMLLFRDAYQLDKRFDKRLGGIYERFIDDIETLIVAAQKRGDVVAAPPRLVAFTLMVLIGQVAQRRLTTDDGVTAAEAADFIVSLVLKGLRPD
jgi:hypothetical protein